MFHSSVFSHFRHFLFSFCYFSCQEYLCWSTHSPFKNGKICKFKLLVNPMWYVVIIIVLLLIVVFIHVLIMTWDLKLQPNSISSATDGLHRIILWVLKLIVKCCCCCCVCCCCFSARRASQNEFEIIYEQKLKDRKSVV